MTRLLNALRSWLIYKLAGQRTVAINCNIRFPKEGRD